MKNKVKDKVNCLKKVNGEASATIMDEEGDSFECSFNNDDCVTIDTKGMSYIVLSLDNLDILNNLIYQAKKYYDRCIKLEESMKGAGSN